MNSTITYLRLGLATSLALTVGGSATYSVMAHSTGPVMPSRVLYQDDDNGSQGRVWDPTPRPVYIHAGSISNLGDDVADLNYLVSPDGMPVGMNDTGRAEYAYTPGIPLSLGELTDRDHVIVVELSEMNDKVIAYGHIGGVPDSNGSLVVNLIGSDDDFTVSGIAVLSSNPGNPGATDASIFIMGALLGDEIGSSVSDDDRDHDNDGQDDDDADGDGIRDDDDDDDDGILDDGDDDDDNDGRTDDEDDDDGSGGGDDDGAGDDDDGAGGGDDDGAGDDDDGAGGGDDDGAGDDDDGPGGGDDDGAGDDDDGAGGGDDDGAGDDDDGAGGGDDDGAGDDDDDDDDD